MLETHNIHNLRLEHVEHLEITQQRDPPPPASFHLGQLLCFKETYLTEGRISIQNSVLFYLTRGEGRAL